MDAEEARTLATKQIKGPVIEPLMEHCVKAIRHAANAGKFEIRYPLDGVRTPITHDQHKAVKSQLRQMGYTVTENPDPDPGHPCSHSYTTVSW